MTTTKENTQDLNITNKEYSWTIIESYFANKHLNRLVRHQLESYNHWINVQLHKTIDMFNPVRIHSEQFKVDDQYTLEIELNFINFQLFFH